MKTQTLFHAAFVITVLTCATNSHATDPGDEFWLEGFGRYGASDTVSAITFYNGDPVIGGRFTTAGNIAAQYIARHDGNEWQHLGQGFNGPVLALTVYNGSLIAGGEFTEAGGVSVNHIARWDGSSWSPLGSGADSPVKVLIVFDGQLVAGGDFTSSAGPNAGQLASWDGVTWNALGLGPGDFVEDVRAAVDFNGALVIGGIHELALWNGIEWSDPYEFPGNASIYALSVYNNQLIAAGGITGNVARWDGTEWVGLGGGLYGSPHPIYGYQWVNALVNYGDWLIAGGYFTSASGIGQVWGIAGWDGSEWHALDTGIMPSENASVCALAVDDSLLYMGGDFAYASIEEVNRIAVWDGSNWGPIEPSGLGVFGSVFAITEYGGDLIIGGGFPVAGNAQASRIARLVTDEWQPFGDGLGPDHIYTAVRAFTEFEGDLIVGGNFTSADGVPAQNIVRWNSMNWNPIGDGVSNPVYCVAVYNGELYANGFRWDGVTWINELQTDGPVYSLLAWEGNLIVAGRFTEANGVSASNIVRWDGVGCYPLGSGISTSHPNSTVQMENYQGDLIVGGAFYTAGGIDARFLARWDGNSWSDFGPDLTGIMAYYGVYSLAAYDGQLFVGGRFTQSEGIPLNYVARWDGSSWMSMGSGVYGRFAGEPATNVHALFPSADRLTVGGMFTLSGDLPAYSLAQWSDPSVFGPTAVGATPNILPSKYLLQNHPNPFNPSTVIQFALLDARQTRLSVYAVDGRRIATLINWELQPGPHSVTWNGTDDQGRAVASGTYIYRLEAGEYVESRRMVLLR